MPVSVKKIKPSIPNISSSLLMAGGDNDNRNQGMEIQSGAPAVQQSIPVQTPVQASVNAVSEKPAAAVQADNSADIKKASTKDTQIIFRTTEDNKNKLKGFFANYGITLSKGIQLACFYLEQQIKAGNVEVNSAGLITKQENR